jgi:cytochrome c oxidase cbb3-type subunit IV
MDINDIRSIVTALGFVTFLWLVKWAYSRRNRDAFSEAANLPFLDEAPAASNKNPSGGSHE